MCVDVKEKIFVSLKKRKIENEIIFLSSSFEETVG